MSKFNVMQEIDIHLHGTLLKAGFRKFHTQP